MLLNYETAAVTAGTTTWINLGWVAQGNLDNFKVTASANRGAKITYSETTGDHAGPMNGYQLLDNETDFTALLITVPDRDNISDIKIELKATWTTDEGETEKESFKITVPVAQHSGDDWTLVANSGSPNGADEAYPGWVEMSVMGLAPASEVVRFTLTDDGGVVPHLPQETWTGPDHDDLIELGETDILRFYIEPGSIESGEHVVTFLATWSSKGEAKQSVVPFTVIIP